MAVFKIQIEELSTKVVEVKAGNRNAAIVKAKNAYANGEINMPESRKEVIFAIVNNRRR